MQDEKTDNNKETKLSDSESLADSHSEDEQNEDSSNDDDEQGLSQYEKLRLERMKRNKERLAKLGLHSEDGGLLKKNLPPKKKRKKPTPVQLPARSVPSRRTKVKEVNYYAEPPNSVAALLRKERGEKPKKQTEAKDRSQRMDKYVHREFQRLRGQKTQVLKIAERNVRKAEREIKYWTKEIEKRQKQSGKKEEVVKVKQLRQFQIEQEQLGCSSKELLQEIDSRMPEIVEAADLYDQEVEGPIIKWEREAKKVEAENKALLLEAIERFPRTFKDATSVLNATILERAPNDPPKPRRSRRTGVDDEDLDDEMDAEDSSIIEDIPESGGVMPQLPVAGNLDDIVPEEEEAAPEEPKTSAEANTPKRRKGRNVGGWISPQFSAEVDRSWLECESPPKHFDLKTHVPQVGDIVLYYPAGHQSFLEVYPDVLGKKTRSLSRVPLWERALAERENEEVSNSSWWNDEWLDNFDKFSRFPIICRVKSTHAEFPPDRFTKIVKDGEVVWKQPQRKKSVDGGQSLDRLRLAVSLQPITPLLPPVSSDQSSEGLEGLTVPPTFSVVTCPSNTDPFLVPFVWAYASYHSLGLNKSANLRGDNESFRVTDFETFGEDFGSFRFDDSSSFSLESANDKAQEASSDSLPASDEYAVKQVIKLFGGNIEEDLYGSWSSLLHLIRSTLPLWKGVTVIKSLHDRKVSSFSAWDLYPGTKVGAFLQTLTPDAISTASRTLDRTLRAQINAKIEEHVQITPGATVFLDPITEDIAPSYYCAVPVGMSLRVVMNRLGTSDENALCYYRTVDAILMDLSLIAENCILYNSPESELVNMAVDLLTQIKGDIIALAEDHFKSVESMTKSDARRRELLLRLADYSTQTKGADEATSWTLTEPYGGTLHDWGKANSDSSAQWVPQTGDRVLYSSHLHHKYVEFHSGDLDDGRKNCVAVEEAESEDWIEGTIAWASPCFPSLDEPATFRDNCLIMCLGIKFDDKLLDRIVRVYWRPCLIDGTAPGKLSCPSCSGPALSFLKPSTDATSTLSSEDIDGLSKCFAFFKNRSLKRKEPAELDKRMTIEGIENGSLPQSGQTSSKSYIEYLSTIDDIESDPKNDFGTRGKSKKLNSAESKTIDSLKEFGFLPFWVSSSEGRADATSYRESCGLVTSPSLCLEMIHGRLENSRYRHLEAVASDVIESYSNAVILVLAEPATRKKKPLSVKKVCRLLNLVKDGPGNMGDQFLLNFAGKASEEEIQYAFRLRRVRDIHAAVLASIIDLRSVELLYGISGLKELPIKPKMNAEESHEDPIRAEARETIRLLCEAIGRDSLENTFTKPAGKDSVPYRRLSIVCNKKPVSGERIVEVIPFTKAILTNEIIRVRVKVGGKLITREKEVPQPTTTVASFEGRQQKVKIICDDEIVKGGLDAIRAKRSRWAPPVTISKKEYIDFEKEDYEGNDDLVKFMFGRPGRMGPCARCLAYRRSPLVCRVLRSHSNYDYDWVQHFGGLGGVDGLLNRLQHGSEAPLEAENEGEDENIEVEVEDAVENEEAESDKDGDAEGKSSVAEEEDDENDDIPKADPNQMLAKAISSLDASKDMLEKAKTFSEAPIRLSKEFVEAAIPIDTEDNHFIYCIICGLSGDLLCCDGCPNVVHPTCVGLEEPPEGDWYCEECERKESDDDEGDEQPFQRLEFDEDQLLEITEQLEEMRSYHPEDRHKRYRERKKEEEKKAKEEERKRKREEKKEARKNKPSAEPKVIFKDDFSDLESEGEEEEPADSDSEAFVPSTYPRDWTGRRRRRKSIQNPIDVLSEMNKTFLETVGITTAEQLFEARTADIAEAFAEWRKKEGLKPLVGSGNVASISTWKNACRQAAFELENGEHDEENGDGERASNSRPYVKRKLKEVDDPFDVLSDMNREFLETIGITSAKELLESKTAEVGRQFAEWRRQEGFPPLAGTGNAASVSMWKNACRKKATELGLSEIADINTSNVASPKPKKGKNGKAKAKGKAKTKKEEPNGRRSGRDRKQTARLAAEIEEPAPKRRKGPSKPAPKKNRITKKVEVPARSSRRRGRQEVDDQEHHDGIDARELTEELLDEPEVQSSRSRRKRRRI